MAYLEHKLQSMFYFVIKTRKKNDDLSSKGDFSFMCCSGSLSRPILLCASSCKSLEGVRGKETHGVAH